MMALPDWMLAGMMKVALTFMLPDPAWVLSYNLQSTVGVPAKFEDRQEAAYYLRWAADEYAIPQSELFQLIEKETDRKYHLFAYNARSGARGLTQMTPIAIRQVEAGEYIVRHPKSIYTPRWSIVSGAQYFRYCLDRARPVKIGKLELTKTEVARIYYVAGRHNAESAIFTSLKYALGE